MKKVFALLLAMALLLGSVPMSAIPVQATEVEEIVAAPEVEEVPAVGEVLVSEQSDCEVLTEGVPFEGTIESNSPVRFSFTPEYTHSYTFYSTGDYDLCCSLYDSNMNELEFDDDDGDDYNFSITYTFNAGETYVFAVSDYSGDAAEFCVCLQANHTGEEIVVTPATCQNEGLKQITCEYCGQIFDEVVPVVEHSYVGGVCEYCGEDDGISAIVEGVPIMVTLEGDDAYANLRFTPEYTHSYTFYSTGDYDAVCNLYDSNMNKLGYDDDNGENNNFSITYTLDVGETYVFEVSTYSGNAAEFCVFLQANHTGEETIVIPATCQNEGTAQFICEECGQTITCSVPKTAHSYVNGVCENCGSPAQVCASGICGKNVTWTLDDAGLLTITGTGDMDNGRFWDEYRSQIVSVRIDHGVTSIGNEAFYWCFNLTSVIIPNGVTSIGEGAFYYCQKLTQIEIPSSVTKISNDAFSGCRKLISIELPDGIKEIGNSAFCDCEELISINLPNSITSIGYSAFRDTGLQELVLPNSLTAIPDTLVSWCEALTSVVIPSSVTSIGENAFECCKSLTQITIPDSVTTLGDGALSNLPGLTSIELPDSITDIGDNMFIGCSNLTNVKLPAGLTKIGDSMFYGCSSLETFSVPDGVTTIDIYAFYGCTGLKEIILPEGLTTICATAFATCVNLETIVFPKSLTYIQGACFVGCNKLNIEFLGDAPEFDGDVFWCATATIYYPADNDTWTSAVLQDYGGTITWIPVKAETDNLKAPDVKISNVSSTGKIKLSWNAVEGAAEYKVYRSTSKNGTYKRLTTVTGTSVTNNSAVAGTQYYYYVVAVDGNGAESEKSNKVTRTCDLAQPEIEVTNVASTGKNKITWEKVEGASKYEVHRATSKTGTYKRIYTTTGTSCTNSSAEAGKL